MVYAPPWSALPAANCHRPTAGHRAISCSIPNFTSRGVASRQEGFPLEHTKHQVVRTVRSSGARGGRRRYRFLGVAEDRGEVRTEEKSRASMLRIGRCVLPVRHVFDAPGRYRHVESYAGYPRCSGSKMNKACILRFCGSCIWHLERVIVISVTVGRPTGGDSCKGQTGDVEP